MKLILVLLAVVVIANAQQCANLNVDECYASREACGFCAFENSGTVQSFCTECNGAAQCVDGVWNGPCDCHTSEEMCERNSVPIAPGTKPAQVKCEWCGDECHNPMDSTACCLKSALDCKDATDACFFCEKTEKCIPKDHQANECPADNNACDALCTTDVNYVCGSNGITYTNICELEKAQCLNANLKKAYVGKCCARLEEADCKEQELCGFCNQCMFTGGENCPRFDCLGELKNEDACVEHASKGCLWCSDSEYCYNSEGSNLVCGQQPTCDQVETRDKCWNLGCSWCNAKDKCQPVNIVEDMTCRCSNLKEGGCKEVEYCSWCASEETCLSGAIFSEKLLQCQVDKPIDKCNQFEAPLGLTSADAIAFACEAKASLAEGDCKYCLREKVCLRADLPENERPAHCDCDVAEEADCRAKSGCAWCKDKCILEARHTPDLCTDKPCAGRKRGDCLGDCAWCDATEECHPDNAVTSYCSCSSINREDVCSDFDRCLWCADDTGANGKCTDSDTCDSGTKPKCHRGLDKEQCAICRPEDANANYMHCGDEIGCIDSTTCDKPTTDECDRITPTPILECVRERADGSFVACLTAQNTAQQAIEFSPTSDRNRVTGVTFAARDIIAKFEIGRQSAFPTCRMRVPFKPSETGEWCICDECVEFSARSPRCPRPSWKLVIQVSVDSAELLRKIKEWIAYRFPNLAKRLDEIDIVIVPTNKRQAEYTVEVAVPEDVDDADVRAVDDSINDKDGLGASLGGTVSSITNSGSTVAQTGSQPSSATTLTFGLVVALLLALLFV